MTSWPVRQGRQRDLTPTDLPRAPACCQRCERLYRKGQLSREVETGLWVCRKCLDQPIRFKVIDFRPRPLKWPLRPHFPPMPEDDE